MAETRLFKSEERMERTAAAGMLRELADRIEGTRCNSDEFGRKL